MPTIGLELKICRIIARKRAADVAHEAGIKPWQLSCIENGRVLPTPDVEAKLKKIVAWKPAVALFLAEMVADTSEIHATPNQPGHHVT